MWEYDIEEDRFPVDVDVPVGSAAAFKRWADKEIGIDVQIERHGNIKHFQFFEMNPLELKMVQEYAKTHWLQSIVITSTI